jgi:hypothetical protein
MDRQPKLLEQVRRAVRARQFSPRTEQAYVGWVRRFVLFHGLRHPAELDGSDVARFLTHLAAERSVSASTQRQAGAALAFLFDEVLQRRIEVPEESHARAPTDVCRSCLVEPKSASCWRS